MNYHYTNSSKTVWLGHDIGDAPVVRYRINAGGYAKISGDDWEQSTTVRVHRKRANSYMFTINKSA